MRWSAICWTPLETYHSISSHLYQSKPPRTRLICEIREMTGRIFHEKVPITETAITSVLIDLENSGWSHFVDYKIPFKMVPTTIGSLKNYGQERKMPVGSENIRKVSHPRLKRYNLFGKQEKKFSSRTSRNACVRNLSNIKYNYFYYFSLFLLRYVREWTIIIIWILKYLKRWCEHGRFHFGTTPFRGSGFVSSVLRVFRVSTTSWSRCDQQ